VRFDYLTREESPEQPLSLVEPIIKDKGLQGARLALADDNTTGRFLNQKYEMTETIVPKSGDIVAAARSLLAQGARLFIADLETPDLLAIADLPEAKDAVIFNTRSEDDGLRVKDCRANILHIIPDRAMKADALAQYLIVKQWPRWFLLHGTGPGDLAFAEDLRRSALRFGGKIVADAAYEF